MQHWCINSRYHLGYFDAVRNVTTSAPEVATIANQGPLEIVCGVQNGVAQIQFDAAIGEEWYRCAIDLLVFDCAANEFFGEFTLCGA